MNRSLITIILLLSSLISLAHTYGEHKEIGDQAFLKFAQQLQAQGSFASLSSYLNLKRDTSGNNYYFSDLSSNGGNLISYGVLNALSGDHEDNPLALEEQLRLKSSVIQAIISLHNHYISIGYTAAPDGKLTQLDFSYALRAAMNLSHFYDYGKSFQDQLKHFDKAIIMQCRNPRLVEAAFKKLGKTNAINMYVSLHTLAIDLAEQSGHWAKTNIKESKQLLFYAFLFNGFADHFLEDSFSSGHLVVNRTIWASVTNNKALHDFYSEHGTSVLNRKREIWTAYGDGQFNARHHSWSKDSSLLAIHYSAYSPEAQRIIDAVSLSLADVWKAFELSSSNTSHTSFINTIPDKKDKQAMFLLNAFPALELVPIPYNSDLSTLFPDKGNIDPSMLNTNKLLTYRNFVRSRVANSLVMCLNSTSFNAESYKSMEFRVNLGSFSKRYVYNAMGGKKGMVDQWHGYTFVYSFGKMGNEREPEGVSVARQIRTGVRSNFDIWISDKRFIGVYSYAEAGIQFRDSRTAFIAAPSVGLQLGSLVNLNYYNLPTWLRIPVQYFLPLKLKYGVILSPTQTPKYFSGFEMDIVF